MNFVHMHTHNLMRSDLGYLSAILLLLLVVVVVVVVVVVLITEIPLSLAILLYFLRPLRYIFVPCATNTLCTKDTWKRLN